MSSSLLCNVPFMRLVPCFVIVLRTFSYLLPSLETKREMVAFRIELLFVCVILSRLINAVFLGLRLQPFLR